MLGEVEVEDECDISLRERIIVDTFIEQVSQHLPQHEAAELRRELLLATSISLCRARIQSVMSMAAPDLMVNLDDGQGSDGEHDAADGLAA